MAGERIARLRKDAGLSQGELAKQMGITRQSVSKWENGLSIPDMQNLILLADIFHTDVEFLLSGKTNIIQASDRPVMEKVVERIVEKPVVQIVEKPTERIVEKTIEKPVLKRIYRVKYLRNPIEFFFFGCICFLAGLIVGLLV